MKRRNLLSVLGLAMASWPGIGLTQQPKIPTVGILAVDSLATEQFWDRFRGAMRDLGYVDGQT